MIRATTLLLAFIALTPMLAAEETSDSRAALFTDAVNPFLQTYCVDCHAEDDPEAGLVLALDTAPDLVAGYEQWTVILQRVAGHEMPPEDADQPSDEVRRQFVEWVGAGLKESSCSAQQMEPRTTIRRLNRTEYDRVVSDLLGIPVSVATEFPAENVGEGFDNIGEVLTLPPLLMEKYLEAAETISSLLSANRPAWKRLFPSAESDAVPEADMRRLASRAFRRPVTEERLARLRQLYTTATDRGSSRKAALQLVLQAVLVSPEFLFRLEEDPAADPNVKTPLDSYGIASRLSFFFWSSIPDGELNQLAAKDKLLDADEVANQALRMMRDERADALVRNFVGQWLELRLLEKAAPDPDLFPGFDDRLRESMVAETAEYFRDLMVNDGSILSLIDSDYSFLNERLARHYGVPGVTGDALQKVQFSDDRRGGVLTHASILTLTSNPTRTSPVKRGKWILENILGTPPPPPPPNVPELEEGDELLGTLRERMQQHRENPSCAVCHRKMDALGFGFENFDAVGAWRDSDGRYEIDASGELPGNLRFESTAELREILRDNSHEFTSCLTRKLLTYALGRALSSRDQCVVDDIVAHVEAHEHRFSSLIVAIVTSDLFRFTGYSGDQR